MINKIISEGYANINMFGLNWFKLIHEFGYVGSLNGIKVIFRQLDDGNERNGLYYIREKSYDNRLCLSSYRISYDIDSRDTVTLSFNDKEFI